MAGETVKTEAICLGIHPWSRTSHIVSWLTPAGKVTTVVKGAVRPKSAFLGQYDLNYTCEILYYARAKGELHALRECMPLVLRESLRTDYRALALAEYARTLASALAPAGPHCADWFDALTRFLDRLCPIRAEDLVVAMVRHELDVLRLAGLAPDFSGFDPDTPFSEFSIESAAFGLETGRRLRIPLETAKFLSNPTVTPKNPQIPLDAARVIGVFYAFHLDCAADVRRSVLALISNPQEERKQTS